MKKLILSALFLSALVALPGIAQTASSNAQPATTGQTGTPSASERQPLRAETPADFWDTDDPNLVNLIMHPFANKKYVQRQVRPIRDRINELDELTAEDSKRIRDVEASAKQGIELASEKTNLADQHLTEVASKAQMAQTAASDASRRVSAEEQVVGNIDQYKGSAQTEIRFRPGQSVLSKNAKDALDEVARSLKGQRNYIIEVRGFSPGNGQAAIASSRRMADSVVRYLALTHQIPIYRLYVMSLGNATMTSEGTVAKRASVAKVEVNVLKNDLISSARP